MSECPRCGQMSTRLYTYPNSGSPPQQDCYRCVARFKMVEKRRAKIRDRKRLATIDAAAS